MLLAAVWVLAMWPSVAWLVRTSKNVSQLKRDVSILQFQSMSNAYMTGGYADQLRTHRISK